MSRNDDKIVVENVNVPEKGYVAGASQGGTWTDTGRDA